MKKKVLLVALLLFSLCTGVFAINKVGPMEDSLVVLTSSGIGVNWIQAVAPEFEKYIKEKYGKQIKVTTGGVEVPALWAKLTVEWPYPSADVYAVYPQMLTEGIRKGYWVKISDYMTPDELKGLGEERINENFGFGISYDNNYWGPVVRKDLIPFKFTSWNDLADPRLKNRITFDSALKVGSGYLSVLAASIYLKQDWKSWANKDGSLNKEAITPALKLVRKWYNNALTLTEGSGTIRPLIERGESIVSCWWSYQAIYEKLNGYDVEFVYPKEGVISNNGTMCMVIPTAALHKNLAIEWVKYINSKKGFEIAYKAKLFGFLLPRADMEVPEFEKQFLPPKGLKVFPRAPFDKWITSDKVKADFLDLYTKIVIQGM